LKFGRVAVISQTNKALCANSEVRIGSNNVFPQKRKSATNYSIPVKRQRRRCVKDMTKKPVKQTIISSSPIPEIIKSSGNATKPKANMSQSEPTMTQQILSKPEIIILHKDSLGSLQHLANKASPSEMHGLPCSDLFVEMPAAGRQTRTSQGLENLFQSGTHAGGIWQSIFCEKS
jgi:hypothetical protein